MLSALTEKQEMVYLTHELSKERLLEIRQTQNFYCPACHEQLVLKIGQVMIPHFAHRKNEHCQVFSEGESALHLQGKYALYRWLQFQHMPVLVEPYLKAIQQRPDLLIQQQDKYIAVEFQCSALTPKRLTKRNKGYQKLGIEPLWIAKAKPSFYEGVQCVQLAPFYQQFILNRQLLTFDVEREQLQMYDHLIHIAGRRYLTTAKRTPIHHQPFPLELVIPFEQEKIAEQWLQERERYLVNRLRFNRRGIQDSFFKLCYEHKIMLQALPNWIGIPSSVQLSVHPVEWQLALTCFIRSGVTQDLSSQLYHHNRTWRIPERAIRTYIDFVQRENPNLSWQDLEISSISEEIYRQYVALKFDN